MSLKLWLVRQQKYNHFLRVKPLFFASFSFSDSKAPACRQQFCFFSKTHEFFFAFSFLAYK